MNNEKIEKPKLKKKYEVNLKICNEFKGLNSLSPSTDSSNKKPKTKKSDKKIKKMKNDLQDDKILEINNDELCYSGKEKDDLSDNETGEPLKKKSRSDDQKSNEIIDKKLKKNYILIENIDSAVTTNELKSYLSGNGISINNVIVLPGSFGIVNFQRPKEMERFFNVCQGVLYKTNELYICKTENEKTIENNFISNLCESSIHLKNLDITTTEEDICSFIKHLPIKSISINPEKETAVIEFDDNQSAKSCLELLDNQKIGERIIRASFLVKSQRPDVFTLKISNLPKDVNKLEIQSIFPTINKIKFMKKNAGQCLVHFKNSEDFNAVLNSTNEFFIKDNRLIIEEYCAKKSKKSELKTQYVLNIYNLPFDTSLNEIKGNFPGVRFIEMLKNADGNFMGSAKLMYDDKTCCEDALKYSKGMTFKHRRVRAEMKVEENGKQKDDKKKIDLIDE